MKSRLLTSILLWAFLISMVSATCTVTFDKVSYSPTEIVTADMVCDSATEKNDNYILNWTLQNGTQVELDTGVTPATVGEHFYQDYAIPSDWPIGIFVNATLIGSGNNDLEGTDSANVSTAGSNLLIISNATIGGRYLGTSTGVHSVVKDENAKKISGGNCKFSVWSNDESYMIESFEDSMFDGEAKFDFVMDNSHYKEGVGYAVKILCFCGSTGGPNECIDEDGNDINNSVGSLKTSFVTNTWLQATVSIDSRFMKLKQHNTVSVNVTNNNKDIRVPIDITYDCRIDRDNNYTRRIRSPFYFPECDSYGECTARRGISPNTTQQQGMDFVVDEHPYLQGRNTTAYCSAYTRIADVLEGTVTYASTSPEFNITSNELNLKTDWQWVSDKVLNSILNLSDEAFNNVNGTGTGNIDIKLFCDECRGGFDIRNSIEIFNLISNVTVKNLTTTLVEHSDYELELLEDGNVEIEIRNVPLSKYDANTWWNISVGFYDLALRQVEALEGIENRTGTFRLDLDCPSTVDIGDDMVCALTAQIEDTQLVQKEVDFTCFIATTIGQLSSVNFNQMVTRSSVYLNKTFYIPDSLSRGDSYVLQCHADYYNFGSRRDSFYDTFFVRTEGGGGAAGSGGGRSPITGGVTGGGDGGGSGFNPFGPFHPFSPKTMGDYTLLVIISLVALFLIIVFVKGLARKDHHPHIHHHLKQGNILGIILTILVILIFIVILIGLVYMGYNFLTGNTQSQIELSPEESNIQTQPVQIETVHYLPYSFLQDNLFRGIILTAFVILAIAFLFRALNIRGELKFGIDDIGQRHREDKKSSKLQDKLNRMVLKSEIEREKDKIRSPQGVKKISAEDFKKALNRLGDKIKD